MVELQALTDLRPGEVCCMTIGEIDRTGDVWLYRTDDVWLYSPAEHKTADLGKDRTIALGPREQEILKP